MESHPWPLALFGETELIHDYGGQQLKVARVKSIGNCKRYLGLFNIHTRRLVKSYPTSTAYMF